MIDGSTFHPFRRFQWPQMDPSVMESLANCSCEDLDDQDLECVRQYLADGSVRVVRPTTGLYAVASCVHVEAGDNGGMLDLPILQLILYAVHQKLLTKDPEDADEPYHPSWAYLLSRAIVFTGRVCSLEHKEFCSLELGAMTQHKSLSDSQRVGLEAAAAIVTGLVAVERYERARAHVRAAIGGQANPDEGIVEILRTTDFFDPVYERWMAVYRPDNTRARIKVAETTFRSMWTSIALVSELGREL